MGNFEDAVHGLAVLAAQERERGKPDVGDVLDPRRLRGQRFLGGELVVDQVTGQEGTVEHSSFVHGTFEAAGRG